MNLIDFSQCTSSMRYYGGLSGNKLGIIYDNEAYIIKFPKNLKSEKMKNITLSYSNSPSCEYLGSKIYELLGIPVHQTLLGTYQGKTVVACKDFLNKGDRLYEFRELKTTFTPPFIDDNGEQTDGNGTKLSDVLTVLRKHEAYQHLPNAEKHFWKMFIVDALIGNADRNNGNHGVIVRLNDNWELAPVYDNGGCLNNKWDDDKILPYLHDREKLETQAYKGIFCIFTKDNDKKINPFQFLDKTKEPVCLNEFRTLVPLIQRNKDNIVRLVDEIPTITDTHKKFIKCMMEIRLNVFMHLWNRFDEYSAGRGDKQHVLCR